MTESPKKTLELIFDFGSPNAYLVWQPLRDLAAVVSIGDSPLVLAVSPSMEIRSVRDMIDYARAKPKLLTLASSGTGSALGGCRCKNFGSMHR